MVDFRHVDLATKLPPPPAAAGARHGWRDVAVRVYRGIDEDRVLLNAAGVTFYALLALFPAIAALVSIYGLFADPHSIAEQVDALSGILPGGGLTVIRDQLTRLTVNDNGSLTVGFVIGLLVSLWSANGGMKGLFDALNAVYEDTETRGFLRLNAITLAFTLAMIGFTVAALICIVAVPAILSDLPGFGATLIEIVRWPLMAALAAVFLAFIYHYGPSRKAPRWRWLSGGSVVAALLWLGVSGAFSYYAANFGTFDKTYGSLGAIIGFMLWIWLSVITVLLGGKLNAVLARRMT